MRPRPVVWTVVKPEEAREKLISKTAEYALRAVLRVAQHNGRGKVRANEMAQELDIPSNYLSKILHSLARAGVLDSERGPHGGFRLAQPAAETSLADIVGPIDPAILDQACLLGRPKCSEESACAVHDHWKRVREPLVRFFRETTIADLLADGGASLSRIGQGGSDLIA